MANIHQTIEEIAKVRPDLADQVKRYVKNHSYGLVYEQNIPDAVRLWTKEPKKYDKVHILPERGKFDKEENFKEWYVSDIVDDTATLTDGKEVKVVPVVDVVPVVNHRDSIYPGFKVIDKVERGGKNDPYHMVINAENYHALEALSYAYAGKVDCIYIDPPYNKEDSQDWKYNCNYVDANDQYRHSKWLAMMERRLRLAKRLLNPEDSILIVTIDEQEYLRLGLLLQQLFPEAKIQMISSITNRHGSIRFNEFTRTNEFIFFVMFGNYLLSTIDKADYVVEGGSVHWQTFRRSNASNIRPSRPFQFYPIYVELNTKKIVKIGDAITPDVDRFSVEQIDGCVAVFPVRDDGTEMMWGVTPEECRERLSKGYIRATKYTPNKPQLFIIQYLMSGTIDDIDNGKIKVTGYAEDGSVLAENIVTKAVMPRTQWSYGSHDARDYGTKILKSFFGDAVFDFPKSVYAVFDCLRLFVSDKPDALILDFFAGSGTTAHATMLLNHLDGGHRRSVLVTNNEVGFNAENDFVENKKLRPYDIEWQKYGIANSITWPRLKCCINGVDINGNSLNFNYGCDMDVYEEFDGELLDSKSKKLVRTTLYKSVKRPLYPQLSDLFVSDGFKENAIFCELTYETVWDIKLDRAFNAVAPILWALAGCKGPIIEKLGKGYATTCNYAVLFKYEAVSKFVEAIKKNPSIEHVFIVTDDQQRFTNVVKRLYMIKPQNIHRLYESYLKSFEIVGEGGLD